MSRKVQGLAQPTMFDFVHAPVPGTTHLAYCLETTEKHEAPVPVANDNQRVSCPKCLKKLHGKPQYANLLFTTRRIDGRGL